MVCMLPSSGHPAVPALGPPHPLEERLAHHFLAEAQGGTREPLQAGLDSMRSQGGPIPSLGSALASGRSEQGYGVLEGESWDINAR